MQQFCVLAGQPIAFPNYFPNLLDMDKSLLALEVILDKMLWLFQQTATNPSGIQQVEIDLLKRYTQDWYEGLSRLSADSSKGSQPLPPAPVQHISQRKEPVTALPQSPVAVRAELSPRGPRAEDGPEIGSRNVVGRTEAVPPADPVVAQPVFPVQPVPPSSPPAAPRSAPAGAPAAPAVERHEPDLNTRFAREQRELGQTLSSRPVEALMKRIDVNERFLFIAELFGGNSDAYGKAIRQLDEQSDVNTALQLLEQDMLPKHQWNPESKVFAHLRDLVEQRFRGN